jgi:hypothetical protein
MDEQEYMRKMKENERLYMYGDLNEGWTWWEPNGFSLIPHGRVEVWTRGGDTLENEADNLDWRHNGLSTDILTWRYVQEKPTVYWTAWKGAKKHEPRPSGKVDVVVRGGQALMERDAAKLFWKHSGKDGDIVFWRHAQEIDDDTFPIIIPERSAYNTQPVIKPNKTQKPTNPKDAVGIKKAPMSTVSAAVLAEVGVGMLEGALKYGRHNYRGVGVRASVYYDATIRHLFSWWEGEDIDPDSQLSHVTKAICSLVVLRDAMIQDKCEDDRPPRSVNFYEQLNELAAKNVEIHGDKSPHHYTIKDEGI